MLIDVLKAPDSSCVSGLDELDPPALLEVLDPPEPSPLPSICENRFCRALAGLVDVWAVDPVDDWSCAAISALIVVGDSCENPFAPEAAAELPEAEVLPERANGLAWLNPVDREEDFGDSTD